MKRTMTGLLTMIAACAVAWPVECARPAYVLVYDVVPLPGGRAVDEALARELVAGLARRIADDRQTSPRFRALGGGRVEVRVPMEAAASYVRARRAVTAAAEALAAMNVDPADVRAALADAQEERRADALARLACGEEERRALFDQLGDALRAESAAAEAGDAARLVGERQRQTELEAKIRETNIDVGAMVEGLYGRSTLAALTGSAATPGAAPDPARAARVAELAERIVGPARGRMGPRRREAFGALVRAAEAAGRFASEMGGLIAVLGRLRGAGELSFHVVARDGRPHGDLEARLRAGDLEVRAGDALRWFEVDRVPTGGLFAAERDGRNWVLGFITPEKSMVRGGGRPAWAVRDARLEPSSRRGQSVIGLELDEKGATLLGELTGRHVGQPIAVVLDGRVIAVPWLRERIERRALLPVGRGEFEAAMLADILRAGPLPARLADLPLSEDAGEMGE